MRRGQTGQDPQGPAPGGVGTPVPGCEQQGVAHRLAQDLGHAVQVVGQGQREVHHALDATRRGRVGGEDPDAHQQAPQRQPAALSEHHLAERPQHDPEDQPAQYLGAHPRGHPGRVERPVGGHRLGRPQRAVVEEREREHAEHEVRRGVRERGAPEEAGDRLGHGNLRVRCCRSCARAVSPLVRSFRGCRTGLVGVRSRGRHPYGLAEHGVFMRLPGLLFLIVLPAVSFAGDAPELADLRPATLTAFAGGLRKSSSRRSSGPRSPTTRLPTRASPR